MASGSEARVTIKIGSRPTLTDEAAKSTMGADGNGDLVGEIIRLEEDRATIQVYEETSTGLGYPFVAGIAMRGH